MYVGVSFVGCLMWFIGVFLLKLGSLFGVCLLFCWMGVYMGFGVMLLILMFFLISIFV